MTTPVVLVILDGWGIAPPGPGNAVELADTPVFNQLWCDCPHGELVASGREVGLPEGQMGNSEVGHMNLGAGRVVYDALGHTASSLQEPTHRRLLQQAALWLLAPTGTSSP